MGEYKHYRNAKEPGVPLFITTTVLDFVHAFARTEAKDAIVHAIARECRVMGAALYGYVVMPHHVHLLIRPRPKMNGPQFMKVFKKESARAVSRILTERELREFDQQRGLNGNTFWQYSFRSIVIESEAMFHQKLNYIHQNPVATGYVEHQEDYRWSSAALVAKGVLDEGKGVPYNEVVDSLGTGALVGGSKA